MKDLNSVILVGNLVRTVGEDEKSFGYLQSGIPVAKFSIAVNRSKKDSSGQWVDEANFFEINFFGKMAESLKPYLTKGTKIAVEGELKQDRWTDQSGVAHNKVSVLASNIQLLGGKKNDAQSVEDSAFVPNHLKPNTPQMEEPPVQPDMGFSDLDSIPF